MRKLASIQKIKNIQPIPNADGIELATVLGWHVVVRKNEFKIGDYIVYIEYDSILPKDNPIFGFMKSYNYKVTTIRLRGQISQGLCFPLEILPKNIDIIEGMDVTDILNIKQYEYPIPPELAGIVKGSIPKFILKTDETRIQSVEHILDIFKNTMMYYTEKIHGESATYYWNNGEFGICSKTVEILPNTENYYSNMADKYDIKNKLKELNLNIAIQGEIFGLGIHGNTLKQQEIRFFMFNIFDIDKQKYYDFNNFSNLTVKLQIPVVPILHYSFPLNHTVDQLVEISKGDSMINPLCKREGIVVRPLVEQQFPELGRLSFKVINPEFLLKHKE